MTGITPLFVENLANSSLLAAFSAAIGEIPNYFLLPLSNAVVSNKDVMQQSPIKQNLLPEFG